MKKIIKLSKFLLLIATVFSYVSSPIAVLANEIATPVVITLDAVDADEDGIVDNFKLTYISEDPNDYEDEKNYTMKLVTTAVYTNGDEEILKEEELSVLGSTLNNTRSSYVLVNPVLEHYTARYVLDVTVYDGETEMYSNNYTYDNDYVAPVGLVGKLNDENNVVVDETTTGEYDVTDEGKYTQRLNILTGELSPIANYRVVYGEGEGTIYSDVMTGEELRTLYTHVGTLTDLTGLLYGQYTYTDSITFEEVEELDDSEELSVVETYIYSYDAVINYGEDNDELFEDIYSEFNTVFMDGYLGVPAKELMGTETVITVGELVNTLVEYELENELKTTVEILDETGTVLDLTSEDTLDLEIKNGYVVKFTNGATASYDVVVVGDTDSDNDFDLDDLVNVMKGYLDEEDMLSMDFVTLPLEEETGIEIEYEEAGTITYEDVIYTNELLKGEDADFSDREIGTATVVFGELPELVYVGDSFELQVLINTDSSEDLIDGLDGLVSYTGLKLDDIVFNTLSTGIYNEAGRVVLVSGEELESDVVLLTLVFTATEEGTATIAFSGNVSRYMAMNEFELETELEVDRNISSNNNLSSLTPSVGTFDVEFDKDITVYTLTVPYDTDKVILSGALEDLYSTVDGLIEYELSENKTTAIITVTAEDGTTKVYTVYIVKESAPVSTPVVYYYSSNNYLESLEIEGYDLDFDKYTDEYKITVKNNVTSLDISALAEHYGARVEITGNGDFKEGENTVVITVTAENGSTREYKLLVTRDAKTAPVNTDETSNTAEKIVIIILIILVVLGLLYLIFKKDDETPEEKMSFENKKEESKEKKELDKKTNNNMNKKKKK